MDDSIEVFWDHDSPTPAAWRMLQGPSRIEEDVHCSPQLPRTKKIITRTRISVDNYPKFEESRKEVDQIINALRRASRDCEGTTSNNLGRRLIIPELPEEEESEDERNFDTVPFQRKEEIHHKSAKPTCTNTSIDLIFDMSGNGEELAPSAMSTNPAKTPAKIAPHSPHSDVWTDDDLFNDDSLMLEVDNASNLPKKSRRMSAENNSIARKTSTPANSSKTVSTSRHKNEENTNSTNSAKGFLNFFMDDGRPTKPSPQKDKSNVLLTRTNNYKFVPKNKSGNVGKDLKNNAASNIPSTSTRLFSNNNSKSLLTKTESQYKNHITGAQTNTSSHFIQKTGTCESKPSSACNPRTILTKSTTKTLDSSIPPEILEELIMEDSWTENEDENKELPNKAGNSKCAKQFGSKGPKVVQKPPLVNGDQPVARNSSYKFTKIEKPSTKLTLLPPNKFDSKTTNSFNPVLTNRKLELVKKSNNHKQELSSDGFLSDDEDMLLEAVALTESQQSCASSRGASQCEKQPNKITLPSTNSSSSSQPCCTALEIERKKKLAMERRMQRMKQQKSNR